MSYITSNISVFTQNKYSFLKKKKFHLKSMCLYNQSSLHEHIIPLLIMTSYITEMASSSSSSSHPMCRSFSSESQRKEWSKRLSLRGMHKTRDVIYYVRVYFSFIYKCFLFGTGFCNTKNWYNTKISIITSNTNCPNID